VRCCIEFPSSNVVPSSTERSGVAQLLNWADLHAHLTVNNYRGPMVAVARGRGSAIGKGSVSLRDEIVRLWEDFARRTSPGAGAALGAGQSRNSVG
jgi:hypothetical protein